MTKIHRPFDTRAMVVFLQAARDGSFTIAGERLGLSPSAVSKVIARLETELGAKLLLRSPRSVTLTSQGSRFFDEADRLAVSLERARAVLNDRSALPRETLRATVPLNFGRAVITPYLASFLALHPQIDLEYVLTNAQVDPIEHRIDVALWIDGVSWIDSRLTIESIAASETVLCAAPSYLEKFGTPRKISDLERHRTLAAFDDQTGRIWPWYFENRGNKVPFVPRNGLQCNAIEVLSDMASQGCGIANLPDYIAADMVRDGRLRVVLPKFRLVPGTVRILYPHGHARRPNVMAFVRLLSDIIRTRYVQPKQKS